MEEKKMFPTSIRLSERSLKQLDFLQKTFGENRTITLTRVIAEAYINEIKFKREKQ
jgi:predicted DNA-binding protein